MTYALIVLPFLVVAGIVTAASAMRPGFARRMRASALTAIVLVALTAIFDNLMIAAGIMTYTEHNISGVQIGLAPLEDFAYPFAGVLLLPALWLLLGGARQERGAREERRAGDGRGSHDGRGARGARTPEAEERGVRAE